MMKRNGLVTAFLFLLCVALYGCVGSGAVPDDVSAPGVGMPGGIGGAFDSAGAVAAAYVPGREITARAGEISVKNAPDGLMPALYGYCASGGGKMLARYVPPGLSRRVTKGFTQLPIFYREAGGKRYELAWCVRETGPLFAAAATADKDVYILESAAMSKYVQSRVTLVTKRAQEADKALARYTLADESQMPYGLDIKKLVLGFTGEAPELTAVLKNIGGEELITETGLPLSIVLDNDRWLLVPAQSAGRLVASVKEKNCEWDEYRMMLTVPPGGSCSVYMRYNPLEKGDALPLGSPELFFGGAVLRVSPVSMLGTNDPAIWLAGYL